MVMRTQPNSHRSVMARLALWLPWTNAAGQYVGAKLVLFLALCAPLLSMAYKFNFALYSPKPLTDLIRESGDWSLRLLVVSLAVTPFAWFFKTPGAIDGRRMIGLASLAYALIHIALYCVDLQFMWWDIGVELFSRLFLTIGLIATVGLIVLGVTSNEWSVRRLGARGWRGLHQWVYVITVLGLLHYFMEVRLDAYEAVLLAGLFIVLMAYRVLRFYHRPAAPSVLLLIAISGAALTAFLEAVYYGLATRFGFWRVLSANLHFVGPLRPAWWVLAAALLVSASVFARFLIVQKPKG
jgi:sulfoxide reductase heme-binding subunit YedZ